MLRRRLSRKCLIKSILESCNDLIVPFIFEACHGHLLPSSAPRGVIHAPP